MMRLVYISTRYTLSGIINEIEFKNIAQPWINRYAIKSNMRTRADTEEVHRGGNAEDTILFCPIEMNTYENIVHLQCKHIFYLYSIRMESIAVPAELKVFPTNRAPPALHWHQLHTCRMALLVVCLAGTGTRVQMNQREGIYENMVCVSSLYLLQVAEERRKQKKHHLKELVAY